MYEYSDYTNVFYYPIASLYSNYKLKKNNDNWDGETGNLTTAVKLLHYYPNGEGNRYNYDPSVLKASIRNSMWPGISMTLTYNTIGGKTIYKYVTTSNYDKVIFINGSNNSVKTNDLTWTNNKYYSPNGTDLSSYLDATSVKYLKPTDKWNNDDAWFAAYYFSNSEEWVEMVKVSDNLWISKSNNSNNTKVIFVRMASGKTIEDKWDGKWNQTADLLLSDGNTYTVTNCSNPSSGNWS